MTANLRDRLKRIQEQKKDEKESEKKPPEVSFDLSAFLDGGWDNCGYQVLRRDVFADAPFKPKGALPSALAVVVPDLAGRPLPPAADFLFFDLETTGLSGGAGTIAFLAAFGRIVQEKRFRITQYLLLDYPGENDFLDAVLNEFKDKSSVIVTYNGKCFDSQILKTRCLMNRIKPPEYYHADLLHPARRLWKNVIFDCSQSSIETRILGIDRSGDIPGALAPEIWFEFLKTGRGERLLGICEHNLSDITGLSSILAAMINIAADPLDAEQYRYDVERLALYWRDFSLRERACGGGGFADLRTTGDRLLRLAADKNNPRAALIYALDQLRSGNCEEGQGRLELIAEASFPEHIRAAALRTLAIDSERRLKCLQRARDFVQRGLKLSAGSVWRMDFEKRKERLEKKLLPC
ncbi:MAG: ribonuclease H-like domain-containing protein [Treponema sp.]|jgi:uncharacterized protein YprB with RNaseH-like and TPR domain|nr:ribonuclease H-like domain-containing protein [Treponema sp.]